MSPAKRGIVRPPEIRKKTPKQTAWAFFFGMETNEILRRASSE